MSDDLNKLMKDIAEGDKVAFRELVQSVSEKMYRLCMRLTGGQQGLAEDALQEALIKLWVMAPRFENKGSVEAYIAKLIYSACMDQHRKQRLRSDMPDDIASTEDIAKNYAGLEKSMLILKAIEALPEKQKRAILLTYYDEQSNRTVAQIMQTTEKAVESLLVRARKTLAMSLPSYLQEDIP